MADHKRGETEVKTFTSSAILQFVKYTHRMCPKKSPPLLFDWGMSGICSGFSSADSRAASSGLDTGQRDCMDWWWWWRENRTLIEHLHMLGEGGRGRKEGEKEYLWIPRNMVVLHLPYTVDWFIGTYGRRTSAFNYTLDGRRRRRRWDGMGVGTHIDTLAHSLWLLVLVMIRLTKNVTDKCNL